MNTHDDLCIAGQDIPDWLTEIQPPVSMSNSEKIYGKPEILENTKTEKNPENPENIEEIENTENTEKSEPDHEISEKNSNSAELIESRIPKRRRRRGGKHR